MVKFNVSIRLIPDDDMNRINALANGLLASKHSRSINLSGKSLYLIGSVLFTCLVE